MTDIIDPFAQPAESAQIVDPFARRLDPTPATDAAPAEESGDFVRGFKRTLPELKQLAGGSLAAVGDVTGMEGVRDYGLGVYQRGREAAESLSKPTDSATEAWSRVTDGDLGAGVDFLQNAAGYTAGQAVQSLAAAAAGAALGSEIPVAGNIAGAVGGLVAKGALKKAAIEAGEKVLAKQIEKGVARGAAEKAAGAATRKVVQRAGGAALGSGAYNTMMEVGSVYPEAMEQAEADGREFGTGDKVRALGSALAAAGVESAADLFNLGSLFRGVKDVARAGGKQGVKEVLAAFGRRAAREVPEGMLREAGTEAVQTGLERFGAQQSLNDADAWRDYIDSAAVGAVGGGLFGTAAATRPRPESSAGRKLDPQPQQEEAPEFGADPGDELRAAVLQAKTPREFDRAHAKLVDYLAKNGRLIEGPPTVVGPDGTAVLPADRPPTAPTVTAPVEIAHPARGLTRDVNLAQGRHPGFTGYSPTLPGLALPDPANGPLSRAVNAGAANGALARAAESQAVAAEEQAQVPLERDAKVRPDEVMPAPPPNMDPETGEVVPWNPEQIRAYLVEQASRGSLPKGAAIAQAFGINPRAASEMRRQILVDRRTQLEAEAAQKKAQRNGASTGRTEPAGAAVDGSLGDGGRGSDAAALQDAAAAAAAPGLFDDAGAGAAAARAGTNENPGEGSVAGPLTYDESDELQDSDITPPSGNPFTIEGAAQLEAERTEGGRVFPVDGGFVVRTPRTAPPAESSAPQDAAPQPQSPAATSPAPASAEGGNQVAAAATPTPTAESTPPPSSTSTRQEAPAPAESSVDTGSSPSPESTPARPSLGNTVQDVVSAWKAQRPHGPTGPETAVARVPGMEGEFQWGPDGDLQKRQYDRRGAPFMVKASRQETDAVLEAIEKGQAEIRTSGTSSPFANRSGAGRVLHQATGRALQAPAPQPRPTRSGTRQVEPGELVTTRDVYGNTVRVRQADLDGDRTLLPMYTAQGKLKTGKNGAIHRENLDPDGSKAREIPGLPYYARTTAKGERPFKTEKAARTAVARAGQPADAYEIEARDGGFIPVRKAAPAPTVEAAAREAATSPDNTLPDATPAQREAGNFKVGRIELAGLDVSIEYPAGVKRKAAHSQPLTRAYGYFRGTTSRDKEHMDVFIGERATDPDLPVFVIDQNGSDGRFDESKVVMGEASVAAARAAYLSNYPKDWKGLASITQMTQDQFRAWVKDPAKTKRPAARSRIGLTYGPGRKAETEAGATAQAKLREAAETVTLPGRQARGIPAAEISVVQDGAVWRYRANWSTGTSGAGGPFGTETFDSRAEARAAAIESIATALPKNPAGAEQAQVERIRAWLDEQRGPNPPAKSTSARPRAKPKNPVAGKEAPPPANDKIGDFGEKLEGARKFLPPSLKEELGDDQIANLPLSKIWPADAHEGIEDARAAALAFAARAEIPPKPRKSYKVRRWVEQVKQVRALMQGSETELAGLEVRARELGLQLQGFFAKARLLAQLPRESWGRVERVGEYPNAFGYEEGARVSKPFSSVTIDGKSHQFDVGAIGPDEVQQVKVLLAGQAPKKTGLVAADFEIRRNRKTGLVFINRKGDSERRHLQEFTGDDATKDARAYLREQANVDALAGEWEKVKARDNVGKGDLRRNENSERIGENRRNGKDVTEQMFTDAFGFRGVQFGNWVGQGKGAKNRQGMLNEAYDALLDLADVLGIPSRAISLDGSLGLALGARGAGKAIAHFERDNLVINLTKTRGAGSLAHEWFHALDNYFSRMRGANSDTARAAGYITYRPEPAWVVEGRRVGGPQTSAGLRRLLQARAQWDSGKSLAENAAAAGWQRDPNHPKGVRPEVESAFTELVESLNESPMAARAAVLDKGAADGYWSRIIERGARSFENYVISKMAQRGWTNDFLANIRDFQEWEAIGKNRERYPYLRPEEEGPIVAAFDALFGTIESRETDGGNVSLFSRPSRSEASALAGLKAGRDSRTLPAERVRAIAAATFARWRGAPKLEVHEQDPGGDAQGAEGWYDDRTGTVHLVAANLRGGFDPVLRRQVSAADRIRMVAIHEAIGHHGIENITGARLWSQLEQTIDRMRASGRHAELFRSIDRRYAGANRSIATREAIAVMAEKGIRNSVIDRVVAALRRFLRDVAGLPLRFSEAELRQHIVAAARYVRDGARPRAAGLATSPAFSRPGLDMRQRVPFVAITGDEFGAETVPTGRLRDQAKRWAHDRVQGREFESESLQHPVRVSARGLRETFFRSARREVVQAVHALPRLLETAVFVSAEQPRQRSGMPVDTATKRMHTGYAPLRIGRDDYVAKLLVRETKDGRFFYDHDLSEIMNAESPSEGPHIGPASKRGDRGSERLPSAMTLAEIEAVVNAEGRDGWRFSQVAAPFHSALLESVELGRGLPKKADAAAWKGWLDGAQRRGEFKKSERDWLGVDAWLDGRDTTTRQELGEFVRANQVQVRDVVLGEGPNPTQEDLIESAMEVYDRAYADATPENREDAEATAREWAQGDIGRRDAAREMGIDPEALGDIRQKGDTAPRYAQYQLPGGSNYRELLLTMPSDTPDRESAPEYYAATTNDFRSNHFDQPNILAHVRFNERTDADGNRVLFLEEVQSDWHQEGRKKGYAKQYKLVVHGYNGTGTMGFYDTREEAEAAIRAWDAENPEAVYGPEIEEGTDIPDAPFKGTDEWAMLAFKRMVRYAAENGFDRIAWTTGEQQAARYDLSKQIEKVAWSATSEGVYRVDFMPIGAPMQNAAADATENDLAAIVGKEIADKIISAWERGDTSGTLSGEGLKIGGEGMKAFYDKILPSAVNKWAKKLGGKVERTKIGTGESSFMAEQDYQTGGWVVTDPRGNTVSSHRDRYEAESAAVSLAGTEQHSVDLTPQMRDAALQGLPLFSRPDLRIATDGRGQRSIEMGGERFIERAGRFYMEDGKGQPRDFHSLSDARAAADRTGGEVLVDDAVEGERPSWSVVVRGVDQRAADAGTPMFSKPDPVATAATDPAQSFEQMTEQLTLPAETALATARSWIASKFADVKPVVLKAVQFPYLLELGARWHPQMASYADKAARMAAYRNMLIDKAGTVASTWQDWAYTKGPQGLWGIRAKQTATARALNRVIHDATQMGIDPSKAYTPTMYRDSRGKLQPYDREAVNERIKAIKGQIRSRPGDSKTDLYDQINELKAVHGREKRRRAAYPKLAARYAALADGQKDLFVTRGADGRIDGLYRTRGEAEEAMSHEQRSGAIESAPAPHAVFTAVRDFYENQRDAMEAALLERIEQMELFERETEPAGAKDITRAQRREHEVAVRKAMQAQIRMEFENSRLDGIYFPMNRDGAYWISAKAPDGEYAFVMQETSRGYEQSIKALKAQGYTIEAKGRRGGKPDAKDAVPGTFAGELMSTLKEARASEAVQDEVYQLLLKALPEMSVRKHSIHRKNVAGFNEDALRAFAKSGFHGAHELARVTWSYQMEKDIDAAKIANDNRRKSDAVTPNEAAAADAYLTEWRERHEWVMSPRDSELANRLGSINFFMYLGMSPAAALVNLTQVAQVTLPVMVARHGTKAARALTRAMRDTIRTKGNVSKAAANQEELDAIRALSESGHFQRTMTHALAGLSEGDRLRMNPGWAKIMAAMGWMFQKAEEVNRKVTGLAAFRVAREAGESFDEALRYAQKMIDGTHGDYSNAARPAWMRGAVGRTVFQFKTYGVFMATLLGDSFYRQFKGETREVRREAFRTFWGVMGMTSLLAGTMGTPIYATMAAVANALAAAFGDDDEPWDADAEFRKFLADLLGEKGGQAVARGLPYLSGVDLSSRVGLEAMLFRGSDRELEGVDAYHFGLESIAGPTGGLAKNVLRGLQMMGEGKVYRGIETMSPKFVRDGMRAARFATEGATSMRGDPILEDIKGPEQLLQLLGFTPSRLAEQYDENRALKNYEQHVTDRRAALMNALALSMRTGNGDLRRDTMQQIGSFNRAWPEIAITQRTIRQSLRQRARYSAQAEGGVVVNRKLAPRLRERVGAE